jgi:hypothetical protein
MTKLRRAWWAIFGSGALVLCGFAAGDQLGGCDLIGQSRAAAIDDENPPPPEASVLVPTAAAEVDEPKGIIIEGELLPGKFLKVRTDILPPEGGKAAYFWTSAEGLSFLDDQLAGTGSTFTGDDGNFWFKLEVALSDKDGNPLRPKSWELPFTLGHPGPQPPEQTIKELAGLDAQKLADFYDKFAGVTKAFKSPDDFWGLHASALTEWGLATNKALPKIAVMLAPIGKGDGPFPVEAGKAALLSVVAELGKPTVEPVDPNLPGTPVSFDGFRVIVLEESGDRTREVASLLTANPPVRQYLNSHCEGGASGWRRWDADVPLANVPSEFREMMNVPRTGSSCVIVAAKKKAVVIPLTANTTPEAFLELLKPYGGP